MSVKRHQNGFDFFLGRTPRMLSGPVERFLSSADETELNGYLNLDAG